MRNRNFRFGKTFIKVIYLFNLFRLNFKKTDFGPCFSPSFCVRACVQNNVYHVWLIINFWSFWLISPLFWLCGVVWYGFGVWWSIRSNMCILFLTPVINDFCGDKSYWKFKWVLLDYKRTRAPSHNRSKQTNAEKTRSEMREMINMLNNRNSLEIVRCCCCFALYSIIIWHISF